MSERARAIKQKIAEGSYRIDLEQLADKLLETELRDRLPVPTPPTARRRKKP